MASSWTGKSVLVTGGTGFIGSILAEALLDRGARVRVPIRAQNYRALSTRKGEIEWMEGDLRNDAYCTALVTGVDCVFHLASHRRNIEFHRKHCSDVAMSNVEMTLALLRALKESPVQQAIFFSTANVPPSVDVIELSQQKNLDGYVLGKAIAETLWFSASRQRGFSFLNVRPVGVYGERDTFSVDGNVIPALMIKARDRDVLEVWGSGKQKLRFLYVHDLVNAVLALLDADVTGIQYITPPELVTVRELAELVRDIVRPGLPIHYDTSKPDGHRSIAKLPVHPVLESFRWTPLRAGLERTFQSWNNKHTDGE